MLAGIKNCYLCGSENIRELQTPPNPFFYTDSRIKFFCESCLQGFCSNRDFTNWKHMPIETEDLIRFIKELKGGDININNIVNQSVEISRKTGIEFYEVFNKLYKKRRQDE